MKRTILALLAAAVLITVSSLWFVLRPEQGVGATSPALPVASEGARADESARLDDLARPARDAVDAQVAAPEAERSTDGAATAAPPRTGRLRGRLVDSGGAPLGGFSVAERYRWRAPPATSGADGRFEVTATFPIDRSSTELHLVARGPRHGATAIDGKVSLGETTDVGDVVLGGAASISGRVVDDNGHGLSGIAVRCTAASVEPHAGRFRVFLPWTSEALTQSSGAFALDDVPPGSIRVWAGADDRFWTATEPLELAEGDALANVEIVLQSIPRDDMLVIQVVDPEGRPVPGASVFCQSSGGMDGTSDERGRFVHYTMNQKRVPVTVVASDPFERWLPAVAENVAPGTLDLVLRLEQPTTLQLSVVDAAGAPVTAFAARSRVESPLLEDEFPSIALADHPGGVVAFVVPTLPFTIEVDAPTYALAREGPFEPDAAPASLEVRLQSLPGLRGIVRTRGGPLAGAEISAHRDVADDQEYLCMELPARYLRRVTARAKSNARGEFVLTLRDAGAYWVRATAEGFAPADLGPLDVDPALGQTDLALELTRGGSIEGRVIGYADESTADMFVALSRGDSYPFTVRTDASGSFRADGLTPGAWSVAKHPRAIDPALMSASLGKSKAPRVFEPDCEVFDGQTTRFDIALHPSGEARLRGRLAFGGKPAAGWDARLSAVGAGSQARATKLDGDGAFAFAVEQAGNYRLELEGRFADDTVRCSARVELAAGDNAWVHDVPGGSIEGHVPARFAEEHVRVRWSLTADGGLQFQGTAFADAAGRFAFARVPAGRVHLVADAPDGSAPARDVELGVDATLQVDL